MVCSQYQKNLVSVEMSRNIRYNEFLFIFSFMGTCYISSFVRIKVKICLRIYMPKLYIHRSVYRCYCIVCRSRFTELRHQIGPVGVTTVLWVTYSGVCGRRSTNSFRLEFSGESEL